MDNKKIKEAVRKNYAEIAEKKSSCCGPKSCCGNQDQAKSISKNIGYSDEELNSVPDGANLGLGCGNPLAHDQVKEGDTVVDLGSGGGFDCFLVANKNRTGKIIGVDMTPEMIEKAKNNAEKGGYENVEFRLGELEDLPVEDKSVDIIISNCVINLVPDKRKVFKEMSRILKSGGKFVVSDIVIAGDLPEAVRKSINAYAGCISGAVKTEEYLSIIEESGFDDIEILNKVQLSGDVIENDGSAKEIIKDFNLSNEDIKTALNSIISVTVKAVKK